MRCANRISICVDSDDSCTCCSYLHVLCFVARAVRTFGAGWTGLRARYVGVTVALQVFGVRRRMGCRAAVPAASEVEPVGVGAANRRRGAWASEPGWKDGTDLARFRWPATGAPGTKHPAHTLGITVRHAICVTRHTSYSTRHTSHVTSHRTSYTTRCHVSASRRRAVCVTRCTLPCIVRRASHAARFRASCVAYMTSHVKYFKSPKWRMSRATCHLPPAASVHFAQFPLQITPVVWLPRVMRCRRNALCA
jgi:hypothetical protein